MSVKDEETKGESGTARNVSDSKPVMAMGEERVFIPKSDKAEPPEQEQLLWLWMDLLLENMLLLLLT